MDIRHFRYFKAIVEEGSFSEAARNRLHISQSSLSRQIRELETELGVILLDRAVQGVKPTAAGLIFLHQADRILQLVQHTIDATRNAKHVVRVGCLPGLEQEVLARLREIGDVNSTTVTFEIIGSISPNLYAKMHGGLLDMAFVWPEEEVSDLHSVVVCRPEIVALLPATHHLSKLPVVSLEALQKEAFITMSPKVVPGFWSKIEAWCRLQGLELKPAHFAENLTSAISVVQSMNGFLLMPEYLRSVIPAAFMILNLVNPPPAVPLCLVYRPASRSSIGWIVEAIAERWNHTANNLSQEKLDKIA